MILAIFILISVFFLVGGLGVWRICIKKPTERNRLVLKYFTYIIIVYSLCSVFAFTRFSFLAVAIITTVGFSEIIFAWVQSAKRKISLLLVALSFYILIASPFLLLCRELSGQKLLALYALVLSFDGFSQVCGQLFGGRKITVKISPNKTLAGLIGGAVLSLIGGFFIFGGAQHFIDFLSAWVIIIPAAFIGDLLASLYKRKCGIKDYSNLLPGHGGILDRFDSFIFSLAFLQVILYLTEKINS